MKHRYTFIIIIALFLGCHFSLYAQEKNFGSRGTDFWVTFGRNIATPADGVNLQIRIAGGEQNATGTLSFIGFPGGITIPFSVPANQVVTYAIPKDLNEYVYNTSTGISNSSIHIKTTAPVTAYAYNNRYETSDATYILPVHALGTEYYQISYTPAGRDDAYAVIATQNTTRVYHAGSLVATLDEGQVYYRSSGTDMTGLRITADKPVSFFNVHQGVRVPSGVDATDNLFEQLAPVNTWGKIFFVPVSHIGIDRVRIVASQNGTVITQNGGTVITGNLNLNAGQWVELEISLQNNGKGCYIQANKPIEVCAYFVGWNYNKLDPKTGNTDPVMAWIPPVEQAVTSALIAPFVPDRSGNSDIPAYGNYALIMTSTITKNNTLMQTGNGIPQSLSAGTWYDHPSGFSFYSLFLHDPSLAVLFTNPAGLTVMGYGVTAYESYYYLASSAMRTLDATFYINNIRFQEFTDVICKQPVQFRAEIDGSMSTAIGHLKWFINDVEEVTSRDKLTWEKSFIYGTYRIKMEVIMTDGAVRERETVIKVETPVLTQPQDLTLCHGETSSVLSFSGINVDAGSCNWDVTSGNGKAVGMNANSGTGTVKAFPAVNTGVADIIVTVKVTPKSPTGCEGEAKTFTITVKPLPVLTQPANLTLCTGKSSQGISFTTIATDTINWEVTSGSGAIIGIGESGTGDIPAFTAVSVGTLMMTVIPKNKRDCSGTAKTFTITVNATPVLDPIPNVTLCTGETSVPISFSGNNMNAVNWEVTSGSGRGIGMRYNNGTTSIAAFTAVNNGNTDTTVTVTVIPKNNTSGCEGESKTFTITVYAVPELEQPANIVFCTGETVPDILFTGTYADVKWEVTCGSGAAIGMRAESGTGSIPEFTAINTTTDSLSVSIMATPQSGDCIGESKTFTIKVYKAPPIDVRLGNDTTICWIDSLKLNAKNLEETSYQWQDGSTGSSYTVYHAAGEYWVIVKNRCSSGSDTINVSYLDDIRVDIGNDTAFCKGDAIHIPLDVTNPYASYLWQPSGSTSPVYVIEEIGVYSVEVSNACTSVTKEITIDEIDCSFDFKIPNIFTPNGDGINELFAPEFIPLENLGDFQMYVYDRWGRMVFSTESYQTLWNGANSNGKLYAEGIYYYYLYFTHKILKDREYKYQGTVTLKRN